MSESKRIRDEQFLMSSKQIDPDETIFLHQISQMNRTECDRSKSVMLVLSEHHIRVDCFPPYPNFYPILYWWQFSHLINQLITLQHRHKRHALNPVRCTIQCI